MHRAPYFRNTLLILITLLTISCGENKDDAGGFNGVIEANASLEGSWKSVAYDFTKTDMATSEIDSLFSFTGGILQECFKDNGERVRTFLGFPESYTYTRVDNQIEFTKGNETQIAKIQTLSSTHFAYTIEHFTVENDSNKREFTSAQLVR
jgi:hypothetical protein